MKPHLRQLLVAGAAALVLLPLSTFAQPMQFSEVSLLVRSHESEASITRQVSQRKVAQKLTSEEEARLKSEGASESLLQTIRNSASTSSVPQTRPANSTPTMQEPREPINRSRAAMTRLAHNDVQIVDVGVGEAVNLSAWGGADREFVFHRRSITDFDQTNRQFTRASFDYYRNPEADPSSDELTMVDPVGTFTHYQTYLGEQSAGWEPNRAEYTSITAHGFARPIRIQRYNPLYVRGVPYALYPIYAAGGVSLYYIGRMNEDVVRVAVVSHWR